MARRKYTARRSGKSAGRSTYRRTTARRAAPSRSRSARGSTSRIVIQLVGGAQSAALPTGMTVAPSPRTRKF